MTKRQQIGFKACLDENKEESSNDTERNQTKHINFLSLF